MNENINIERDSEKEKIELATIYIQNGRMGIEFSNDANLLEVNYFLESYVKIEREDYEELFKKVDK